jgi:hypothetical protein
MSASIDPELLTWARPLMRAQTALKAVEEAAESRCFVVAQHELGVAIRNMRIALQVLQREQKEAREREASH